MLQVNLQPILEEREISQNELSRATGIRLATINDIANHKRRSVHLEHLTKIMDYLKIADVNEILVRQ